MVYPGGKASAAVVWLVCRWVVAGQETEDAAGGFSRVTGTGECSPAAGWWWFTGGAREKEGAASARGVVNKRVGWV